MKNSLKIERAIHKRTQEELAKKVGVSLQTINALEAKKYIPSAVLALKIAAVFQKKTEDIFTLEKED